MADPTPSSSPASAPAVERTTATPVVSDPRPLPAGMLVIPPEVLERNRAVPARRAEEEKQIDKLRSQFADPNSHATAAQVNAFNDCIAAKKKHEALTASARGAPDISLHDIWAHNAVLSVGYRGLLAQRTNTVLHELGYLHGKVSDEFNADSVSATKNYQSAKLAETKSEKTEAEAKKPATKSPPLIPAFSGDVTGYVDAETMRHLVVDHFRHERRPIEEAKNRNCGVLPTE